MKIEEAWGQRFERSFMSQIAVLLVVSVLFWALGVPTFVSKANAAYMSEISDTLSDSNNGSVSRHVISFTNATSTTAGETIKIQLDPTTHAFDQFYSSATTTDITVTGFTHVAEGGCTGAASEAYATSTYNNGSDENLTFTVCANDTIAAGAITVTVGAAGTLLWQNPASTNSYRITIGGTQTSSGETRVAILPHVTLTASVNSTFTFTVTGVNSGTSVNSTTTTITSTATTLPFGTLSPGVPAIIGQQLNVTTNATNGFSVTVQENQPPTSGSGALIYLFKDGATTTSPIEWTAPQGILDSYQTYAHFGITSDDADTGSGEFVATSTTPFVGNIITPRVIFTHNGPSDGTTQNAGLAKVAYAIQTTTLLPAGDYTNVLTYVATPTF
jgi:hypothetical protein